MTIREALRLIIKSEIPLITIRAKVTNVYKDKMLCDVQPLNGDAEILDVKLSPDETQDYGFLPIPKFGSTVMIVFEDKNNAYVSMVAEVESYLIKINSTTLFINPDGIELNGSDKGGLIVINSLVTKINNLENDINSLKTAFSSWVVVPSDGGVALKAVAASWYGSSLTPTKTADIENDKIKHGSN